MNLARAQALMDLRQPAKARAILQAPGPLDKPDMNPFRRLCGRAALDLDLPAKAAKALAAIPAAEREPDDALHLAWALVLSGEDAAARSAYEALLAGGKLQEKLESADREERPHPCGRASRHASVHVPTCFIRRNHRRQPLDHDRGRPPGARSKTLNAHVSCGFSRSVAERSKAVQPP